MAITGVAAIAAVGASTVVSTTAIVVAGLAVTAVGMITGNSLLKKIGGGLSIGAAGAGLAQGLGTSAATVAPDAATSGMNAASVADAAGAGSQAAGNVAESTMATVGSGAPMGYSVADTAASAVTGSGAPVAFGSQAAQAVDPALTAAANPAMGNSINASLSSPSQAMQSVASDTASQAAQTAGTAAPNVNPSNAFTPNTIASNTNAASAVAPGSQAAAPATGAVPGLDGVSYSGGGVVNGGTGLQSSGSWMQDTMNSMGKWWSGLDDKSKLAVGQTAAGLVQGVGSGAMSMLSASKAQQLAQEQQDFQHANLSGAGSIPTVKMAPTGAQPYKTPAQVQQAAQQTVTPQYQNTGLVNGAKG